MEPKSLYVHIPFCSHKCLFCSFDIAVSQTHRADDYLKKIEREAGSYAGTLLQTVYIGGGTPSVLSNDQLRELMNIIKSHFVLQGQSEITIEINPEGLDFFKASSIMELGFNRISLGVQTFNDRYLKFLGRKHDAYQAMAALGVLRQAGFSNISLDLMYGFPSQSLEELNEDLKLICSTGCQHLSLYTLTIEPHSRFYAQSLKLDEDEKLAEHYQEVIRILGEHGYIQYEVSNFAKAGFESRHNCRYWLGQEYIALGMAAHGFENARRYWNKSKLSEYLSSAEVREGFEDLDEQTLRTERLLFGLRMNQGVEAHLVDDQKKDTVQQFIQQGLLVMDGTRLKVTDKGRLVLDELSVRLI